MPSTHRRRLSDFIKAFAKSSTSSLDNVEVQKTCVRVSETAATGSTDRVLFHANGYSAIKRIRFIPEVAVASASGTKWILTFASASISANNTYSTYTSDSSTLVGAFVQYTPKTVYQPADEVVLAKDEVITMDAAITGTPTLQGLFIVEYVPLLDN